MKKILIIAVVAIVLIVIGVFGYAAMNANSLIASYKPDLEKTASDALGSKVELGNIEVSVFPSVKLHVAEFSVSEKSEKLKLKDLFINVSVVKLITGTLQITDLLIDSPALTILKQKDVFWVAGLPKPTNKPDSNVKPKAQKEVSKSDPAPTEGSSLALNLDKFVLSNASLTLKDLDKNKELRIGTVTINAGLALKGKEIDLSRFDIDGSVLKNGTLIANGTTNGGLNIDATLSKLNQEDLTAISEILDLSLPIELKQPSTLKVNIKGDLNKPTISTQLLLPYVDLPDVGTFVKDVDTNLTIVADLGSEKHLIKSPATKVQIGEIPVKLSLDAIATKQEFSLNSLHIDGFSGTVDGSLKSNLANKNLETRFELANLQMGDFLKALKPGEEPVFTGDLKNLTISATGNSSNNLPQSLNGKASLLLENGVMVGSNLAGDVLTAVTGLPFIQGSLQSEVPEEQRKHVDSENTPIKKLSADFNIGNGTISTDNLSLISEIFTLASHGSATFDGAVNFKGDIIFTKEFSAALVSAVKELGSMLDAEERLSFPVKLEGKAPKFKATPDTSKLLKKAATGAATKALSDFLSGGKKEGAEKGGKSKGLGGLLGGF